MTIDLSYLKSLVGDEPEVIEEMLQIFCEDVPNYLDTMRQALSSSDWETIAKTAHTLKSSLGFTGRMDMVELAEKLQHQKTAPDTESVVHELQAFIGKTEEIIAEFRRRLSVKDFH